jgi:hypothetical protein
VPRSEFTVKIFQFTLGPHINPLSCYNEILKQQGKNYISSQFCLPREGKERLQIQLQFCPTLQLPRAGGPPQNIVPSTTISNASLVHLHILDSMMDSRFTGEPLLTNFQETNNPYLRTLHGPINCELPVHLTNKKPRAYEHLNKLTLTNSTIYLMETKNTLNLRTFNLQTHFKE